MNETWPTAQIGNVGRLHALAGAFPGAAVCERPMAAPFETVWAYFSEMEVSIPTFDETVAEFNVIETDGSRLVARARSPWLPFHSTLDVDLEPGWCLMTARPACYMVAFAAEPSGEHTRFSHFEAANVAGPRLVRQAAARLLTAVNKRLTRHVERDLDGIEEALGLHG